MLLILVLLFKFFVGLFYFIALFAFLCFIPALIFIVIPTLLIQSISLLQYFFRVKKHISIIEDLPDYDLRNFSEKEKIVYNKMLDNFNNNSFLAFYTNDHLYMNSKAEIIFSFGDSPVKVNITYDQAKNILLHIIRNTDINKQIKYYNLYDKLREEGL